MQKKPTDSALILDTALHLANACGWERLHLFEVARSLDVGLDEIARHYRDKDELVEAWFDRADQAMLNHARTPQLAGLNAEQRLESCLLAWLDSLAPYRALTAQMLLYKLEPGHIHLQILGLMRISRTVQWWREAAGRQSLHLRRVLEESLLTGAYLCSFSHWLRHPRQEPAQFRAYLRSQLRRGPLPVLLRR